MATPRPRRSVITDPNRCAQQGCSLRIGSPTSARPSPSLAELTMERCAEGCYKHSVNGKWVCCKCGHTT
jgi:hypothetical protein